MFLFSSPFAVSQASEIQGRNTSGEQVIMGVTYQGLCGEATFRDDLESGHKHK